MDSHKSYCLSHDLIFAKIKSNEMNILPIIGIPGYYFNQGEKVTLPTWLQLTHSYRFKGR